MSDRDLFQYVESWQRMTPDDAETVRAFWLREGTNVQGQVADQRISQVVMRVLAGDDQVVAVSTVEPQVIPRLMQPMYYYRCLVGATWRQQELSKTLLLRSFDVLERWAGARDFPCIGLLLELENPVYEHTLRQAHWDSPDSSTGYTFIGRSRRGFDLRVCYFQGAKLKTTDEIEAMLRPSRTACQP